MDLTLMPATEISQPFWLTLKLTDRPSFREVCQEREARRLLMMAAPRRFLNQKMSVAVFMVKQKKCAKNARKMLLKNQKKI